MSEYSVYEKRGYGISYIGSVEAPTEDDAYEKALQHYGSPIVIKIND